MGLKDIFKPKVVKETVRIHDDDYNSTRHTFGDGRTKYGNITYTDAGHTDHRALRDNSRGVYSQSLIARGIVGRLIDNVINTGLTWESSPLWAMIPSWKSKSEDERYEWTENVENRFELYANSKESDIKGRQTLNQLQRLIYKLHITEGEYFLLCRYLNSNDRMSPLAIQVLNNDQVVNPNDPATLEAVKARGATVKHGCEYDTTGKLIAIHVAEGEVLFGGKTKRIPIYGPKSKRLFVIHGGNFEDAEQYRGFPELASFIYELDRLTEYDISELEAVVANATWFAAIEMDKDGGRNTNPLKPAGLSTANSDYDTVDGGIESVSVGKKALIMQNLKAGQKMNMFVPSRPNPNYEAYIDAVANSICGSISMPLSVFKQKFQASYSAARAEILFFWNNIVKRRDDFQAGFLIPFYQAWFTEEVNNGNISAPGYKNLPVAKQAWLHGTWNGISRPVVDPTKEVKAVEARLLLGHTTGEREAKAYNGSDYRENIKRLKTENEMRADVNTPLNPSQYASAPVSVDGVDQIEQDFTTLKANFDSYGVGVRAGAITPQTDDETHFRELASLPEMGDKAKAAWETTGGVRTPITLAKPGESTTDVDNADDDTETDEDSDQEADE